MHFRGAYSQQLTVDDVRQIIALVRDRPDILKPVYSITIERPDQAEVNSGNLADISTGFDVRKRNGRWFILLGSITKGRVITTS
jgi:hypothetical protein